jgi:hypothetical protein
MLYFFLHRLPLFRFAAIALSFACTLSAAVPEAFSDGRQHAIVTTIAADGSKGSYSRIDEALSGPFRFADHNMMETDFEVRAAFHKNNYYILEGGAIGRVTSFEIKWPGVPVQVYSARTPGEGEDIRPWALVPVDERKAYLLRTGTSVAWIVDPLAESDAAFRIGTMDLGAAVDADNLEMRCGVAVDDRAFIAVNVTDAGGVFRNSYMVVIDTANDAVIAADVEPGISAVPLEFNDVSAVQYLAATGKIYVQAAGLTDPVPDFTGGILAFDPDSYETDVIIDDDGPGVDHGYTIGMAVVSASKAFFIAAESDTSHILYHFNPATGETTVVRHTRGEDYLKNKQFASKNGGIGLDRFNRLWISNITNRRIEIINTVPNDNGLYRDDTSQNDIPKDSGGLAMAPDQIVFVSEPDETKEDEEKRPSSGGDSSNFCFIEAIRR